MNLRLTAATALLGSLLVILSQFVAAYSLEDQFGVVMANVTLFEKHGPVTAILAAVAGLAVVFLVATAAREPESARPVARVAGIVVAGMGLAALLVFLLVDLPDIGDTGMYDAPGSGNLDATGAAAAGLWLELVGAIVLMLAGAALATVKPDRTASRGPERPRDAGVRPRD